MATAADMRDKLRRLLDDQTSSYSQGQFWTDAHLDLALDMAQFAVVKILFDKKQWTLIDGLLKSVSGTGVVALPADYMFANSAEISPNYPTIFYRRAALYIGYPSESWDWQSSKYFARVIGANVEFRIGGLAADGRLHYVKRPVAVSGGSTHTEMRESVYDTMVYLAASILQQKDFGGTRDMPVPRHIANFRDMMKRMSSEPGGVFIRMNQSAQP